MQTGSPCYSFQRIGKNGQDLKARNLGLAETDAKRCSKMEAKKDHKIDEVALAKAVKLMFGNMKSGRTVYLSFSRMNFRALIFTIAMSVIANIVLIDLLIRAPIIVEKTTTLLYLIQFSLSAVAIIAGLWLFFKGINLEVDR